LLRAREDELEGLVEFVLEDGLLEVDAVRLPDDDLLLDFLDDFELCVE